MYSQSQAWLWHNRLTGALLNSATLKILVLVFYFPLADESLFVCNLQRGVVAFTSDSITYVGISRCYFSVYNEVEKQPQLLPSTVCLEEPDMLSIPVSRFILTWYIILNEPYSY